MSESEAREPKATGLVDGGQLLTNEERNKMIDRIHSLVYWVGMLIPEHELIGGSEIDLREVIYNLTSKENLTPEDIKQANDLIALMKSREKDLEGKLAQDQLTVDTAKGILEEICGLLRAIEELRSVESVEKAEFRKKQLLTRVEDAKRWQKFVQSIKPNA